MNINQYWQNSLAMAHMGIIVKLSYRHWRRLPVHVQVHFGLEDMISEVMLKVSLAESKYDSSIARSATFVWRVADNYCKVLVHRYELKKRSAIVVPLEDATWLSKVDQERKFLESKRAVERVLAGASAPLRDRIEQFLEERRFQRWDEELVAEMRSLAHTHSVRYEDFLRVFQRV